MRKLLRIENLLWLVPLLLGIYAFFNLVQTMEVGFFGRGFVASVAALFTLNWVWILMPGYFLHYFLRLIHRRSKVICILHIVISLALSFPVDGFGTSVVPGWHTTILPPQWGSGMMMPFYSIWFKVLFWIVQLTFIIYSLVLINRWRKLSTS